jgi:type IV pilus assembly protein PilB
MQNTLEILKQAIFNEEDPSSICDLMIVWAIEMNASDIHLEPEETRVRLRYRVDWVLRIILEYPLTNHPQIVARYKILGNLKMDETRKPQDGRISHSVGEKMFDLRLSTLPTVHGEKVVMRIVDKTKKVPDLVDLGLEWRNEKVLFKAIAQPNGIILNSGPTGSGKSTTLYSILKKLNTPHVNIMTFEDPVEIIVDGINQSQVFPDIGYTFASGLRTALRQDPDIMMVWEIRDNETADIALEAALTGHLVLSTIHTNSAAETVTRLINLGIKTFLIPATINAIISQRLVRKINPEKAIKKSFSELEEYLQKRIQGIIASIPKDEIQARLSREIMANPVFYEPDMSKVEFIDDAYLWRIAVYEVMEISQWIKDMIMRGATSNEIFNAALKDGMISMEQDGIIRVLQGMTTLEEVYSVVRN